jgi:hypothetical protein
MLQQQTQQRSSSPILTKGSHSAGRRQQQQRRSCSACRPHCAHTRPTPAQDIPPNQTIYVHNLYEKLNKQGEPAGQATTSTAWQPGACQQTRTEDTPPSLNTRALPLAQNSPPPPQS